jgi:hypothetical protein
LLVRTDITPEAMDALDGIPAEVARQFAMLDGPLPLERVKPPMPNTSPKGESASPFFGRVAEFVGVCSGMAVLSRLTLAPRSLAARTLLDDDPPSVLSAVGQTPH